MATIVDANQIFINLFFENWMSQEEWDKFLRWATNKVKYNEFNLMEDLNSDWKTSEDINSKLDKIQKQIQKSFK